MSTRGQHTARPSYKLKEVILPGRKAPEKGKYRAIVTDRDSYGTATVIDEMLDYSSTRYSPYIVESIVSGVLESMIKNTLSDGITRRFGDYFAVRLEVKGTFDDVDAAFDPKKNAVKVVLVPLKRFRASVSTQRPQNKVKPPRALMTEIRGENSPVDCVKLGENIVVTGHDLTVVDMSNQMDVYVYDRNLKRHMFNWCISDMLEHTPNRIVLPFPEEFKSIDFHPDRKYRKMHFEYCTDSGKSTGRFLRVKYKHGVEVLLP